MHYELDQASRKVLRESLQGHHIVQIYRNEKYLANAVGLYLFSALSRKEGAIVIATQEHWNLFEKKLKNDYGLSPETLRESIRVLDADKILSQVMAGGKPEWALFSRVIGSVLKDLRTKDSYLPISAYGEMVNLLWQRGKSEAAIQLEALWNDLIQIYPLSLFCSYSFKNFDEEIAVSRIKGICTTHSHFIPSENHRVIAEATENAFSEVLGPGKKGILQKLVNAEPQRSPLPDYLATLLWMEKNMPRTAETVRSAAQKNLPLEFLPLH